VQYLILEEALEALEILAAVTAHGIQVFYSLEIITFSRVVKTALRKVRSRAFT
jgi:hypothetical protein